MSGVVRGERDRAVDGPLAGQDHGGRLRFVVTVGPRHGPLCQCRYDSRLAPGYEQPVEAVGVEAIAQRCPGDAGLRQQRLGRGVGAGRQ